MQFVFWSVCLGMFFRCLFGFCQSLQGSFCPSLSHHTTPGTSQRFGTACGQRHAANCDWAAPSHWRVCSGMADMKFLLGNRSIWYCMSTIDFSPTAIAFGSSAIVKVSGQNCFRTLHGSLGQIRVGLPKGSAEGPTTVPPRFHQGFAEFVLPRFHICPKWLLFQKRFFFQGSANCSLHLTASLVLGSKLHELLTCLTHTPPYTSNPQKLTHYVVAVGGIPWVYLLAEVNLRHNSNMTCEKHSGLERQNRPAISCQRNTPRSSNTIMQMMFQHHRCPNTSVESLLLRSCQLYQGLVLLDVSMVLVPSFRNLWFNSESSRVRKQGKEFKGLSAVTWFFQRWHPQISTNELCTNMPRAGGAQLVRRERRWSCWLNDGNSLFSWRKNAWPTCSMHAFFSKWWYNTIYAYIHTSYVYTNILHLPKMYWRIIHIHHLGNWSIELHLFSTCCTGQKSNQFSGPDVPESPVAKELPGTLVAAKS